MPDPSEKEEQAKEAQFAAAVKNITLPFCSRNVNKAILAFSSALIKSGVQKQVIMDTLTALKPQLSQIASEFNDECHNAIARFNYLLEQESLITDYLGKALLKDIEPLFPQDPDTEELIMTSAVNGILPRYISAGLVDAIKSAHGEQAVEEYENIAADKVEKYRAKANGLIDFAAFAADKEISQIRERMIAQFRKIYEERDEGERKRWFLSKITASAGFKKMKRDLTDGEYRQLIAVLFGIQEQQQPRVKAKGIVRAS